MSFTYPAFLYALGFLIIPILIHLFNFRRYKTVRFSQVRFLKTVQVYTKASSKLKHLLTLLARIIALSCLILAFAKPYLPGNDKAFGNQQNQVSIYIDNSFSMAAKAEQGQALDQAKKAAIELLNAYPEESNFQLISNDFLPEEQVELTKSQIQERIQSLSLSSYFHSGNEILTRQQEMVNTNASKSDFYFISDFQKNSFKPEELNLDSTRINFIPVQTAALSNIGLDSLWFESPFQLAGSQQSLWLKAQNYGLEDRNELELKLYVNAELKSPDRISVNKQDAANQALQFRLSNTPLQLGHLLIKDYPIHFDDTLFFNLELQQNAHVLHIYGEALNQGINQLYESDRFFVYQQRKSKALDYSSFAEQDLILLDELSEIESGLKNELIQYVSSGGSLFIIPNKEIEINQYNALLAGLDAGQLQSLQTKAQSLGRLNEKARLYEAVFDEIPKNLDFPNTQSYWKLSKSTALQVEPLLELSNGEYFLASYRHGDGLSYLCSSPLEKENSSFVEHALFVPTVYNMAILSNQKASYHILGERVFISSKNKSDLSIKLVRAQRDYIPPQRSLPGGIELDLSRGDLKPGHYQVIRGTDSLGVLSLNYPRKESDLELWDLETLKEKLDEYSIQYNWYESNTKILASQIKMDSQGKSLWKYFLIAALLFLGIETLLLRLLK